MNKLFWILALVTLSVGCASNSSKSDNSQHKDTLVYDAARPLRSLHGPAQQNAISELDVVLQGLLIADNNGSPLPLVVYIHGRGNEPKKSVDDSILRHLPVGHFGQGKLLSKIEADDVRAFPPFAS